MGRGVASADPGLCRKRRHANIWRLPGPDSVASGEIRPAARCIRGRPQAWRGSGYCWNAGEGRLYFLEAAYRRLILRLHPDSGASAVLFAQITAARDCLLGKP